MAELIKFPISAAMLFMMFYRLMWTNLLDYIIYIRLYREFLSQLTCHFDTALRRRHNGRDGVSNHQPDDCLLNYSFGCRSKKTPKLRVTGLCAWNSPVTGEVPALRASNAKNVSIWWRHYHGIFRTLLILDNCRFHARTKYYQNVPALTDALHNTIRKIANRCIEFR